MLVSLNWIKEFINVTEENPQTICDILTEKSAEVDDIIYQGKSFENIVVGKIKEVSPHPDADALRICMVDVAEENLLQVVCGGSNLEVNQDVVVAKLGASVLWHGEGEPVIMKKTKIRGVESLGMICAAEEVGLSDKFPKQGEKEIVDISNLKRKVGENLADVFNKNDVIFEIENTSITNRADQFSHIGFAREFVACDLGTWKEGVEEKFAFNTFATDSENKKIDVNINFDALEQKKERKIEEILPEYTAITLSGVDGTTQSSEKIQSFLQSVNITPKNALVDITNFVMFELGMPLHAFDTDQDGNDFIFDLSEAGEKMINLDGEEKILPQNAIIIKDSAGEILDCCGIQGAKNSGIAENTQNILLHAPVYNPVLIRRASIAIAQRTDASVIYEKGVPVQLAKKGLIRAIELICEHFPNAKVTSDIFQKSSDSAGFLNTVIDVNFATIKNRIGLPEEKLTNSDIVKILEKLEFEIIEKTDNSMKVSVPYFRGDIAIADDLTEEVARIYGLNNIDGVAPIIAIEEKPKSDARKVEQKIANVFVNNGFYEVLTLSFYGKKLLEKMGMPTDNSSEIHVKNPLSEDVEIMRTSLSPRLFEVAERNIRHTKNFRIFESGNVYSLQNGEKVEEMRITSLLVGDDFFSAKAVAEEIFASFHMPYRMQSKEYDLSFAHPGRGAVMTAGKDASVKIFEVHPRIAKEFNLPTNTSIVCITLKPFENLLARKPKMQRISKFPAVDFDISVLCDDALPVDKLIKGITKVSDLIVKAEVESVWRGEGVDDGQKSVTLSFRFQSDERTLTDKEVKKIEKDIIAEVAKKGGVERF